MVRRHAFNSDVCKLNWEHFVATAELRRWALLGSRFLQSLAFCSRCVHFVIIDLQLTVYCKSYIEVLYSDSIIFSLFSLFLCCSLVSWIRTWHQHSRYVSQAVIYFQLCPQIETSTTQKSKICFTFGPQLVSYQKPVCPFNNHLHFFLLYNTR